MPLGGAWDTGQPYGLTPLEPSAARDRGYSNLPAKSREQSSAQAGEPVVRSGDKIQIDCPECSHLGTHLGTCSWSQMRSGRVWAFFAEEIGIRV